MSDLPSREFAAGIPDRYTGEFAEWFKRVAIPLAVYWQSGRLVDRDTIDHDVISAIIDNVAARVDSEGVTGDFRAEDYTVRIVAAIGDTR